MCRKELNLHKNKQVKKKQVKKRAKVQAEKPCPAQIFFLMNEDVLN